MSERLVRKTASRQHRSIPGNRHTSFCSTCWDMIYHVSPPASKATKKFAVSASPSKGMMLNPRRFNCVSRLPQHPITNLIQSPLRCPPHRHSLLARSSLCLVSMCCRLNHQGMSMLGFENAMVPEDVALLASFLRTEHSLASTPRGKLLAHGETTEDQLLRRRNGRRVDGRPPNLQLSRL